MSAVTYAFQQQLAIGEAHERRLDEFFSRYNIDIRPATDAEQRMGIDRFFTHRSTGAVDAMEYKADDKAGQTGNAFIETVSVDTTGKPGWAVASQARFLVYLVVEPEAIYLVSMQRLRDALPRWREAYREVAAQNDGYRTLGLLVPLHELERIAVGVW